jgi:regulator of replication initiation timing
MSDNKNNNKNSDNKSNNSKNSNDKKLEVMNSQIRNLNKSVEFLEDKVEELEDENESLRRDVENLRSKYLSEKGFENLSDAERIVIGSWSSVSVNKSKNKERAVSVVKHWSNIWREGQMNKDGEQSVTLKQVKNYFDVQWNTARRVCEYIEQLTNGKISLEKSDNTLLVKKERVATDVDELD